MKQKSRDNSEKCRCDKAVNCGSYRPHHKEHLSLVHQTRLRRNHIAQIPYRIFRVGIFISFSRDPLSINPALIDGAPWLTILMAVCSPFLILNSELTSQTIP